MRWHRAVSVLLALATSGILLSAQEANSGMDLRATISGEGLYSAESGAGSTLDGGFRAVLYPVIKLGQHWNISGTVSANSVPYDPQESRATGTAFRAHVLQATVNYSRVGRNSSLVVRAGQMPTAFGSFLLRYDEAENPLISTPAEYGYYYNPVSTLGLLAVQADLTLGKWDGRLQFANSSPANPRNLFDKDQYPNWAAGAGYTIRQGLRVGVSGFRGPYLDRDYPFYFPGEAKPRDLPATAAGVDVDWAFGHWNIRGEWQHFVMSYRAIPTFRESAGYAEMRRVLSPRWFVAARAGYLHSDVFSGEDTFEGTVGFRPNQFQIVKAGCLITRAQGTDAVGKAFVIQIVSTVHPLSLAWR